MVDRSRLDALKQVGQSAWQGLKTLVTGVDVVVEAEPSPASEAVSASESPPEAIGTAIGRRALAAAEHRVGATSRAVAGAAAALEEAPLTLALYPGAGAPLAEQALGIAGAWLPADGDPEVEATARDLAWLPLAMGRQLYERLPGSRLLAVGGYREAVLVRFAQARPRFAGIWCCLGEDELGARVVAGSSLVLEEPGKLLQAIGQQQVALAVLGGDLADQALRAPGATVEQVLAPEPDTGVIPVWGLFSTGRTVAVMPVETPALRLVPMAEPPPPALEVGG